MEQAKHAGCQQTLGPMRDPQTAISPVIIASPHWKRKIFWLVNCATLKQPQLCWNLKFSPFQPPNFNAGQSFPSLRIEIDFIFYQNISIEISGIYRFFADTEF